MLGAGWRHDVTKHGPGLEATRHRTASHLSTARSRADSSIRYGYSSAQNDMSARIPSEPYKSTRPYTTALLISIHSDSSCPHIASSALTITTLLFASHRAVRSTCSSEQQLNQAPGRVRGPVHFPSTGTSAEDLVAGQLRPVPASPSVPTGCGPVSAPKSQPQVEG